MYANTCKHVNGPRPSHARCPQQHYLVSYRRPMCERHSNLVSEVSDSGLSLSACIPEPPPNRWLGRNAHWGGVLVALGTMVNPLIPSEKHLPCPPPPPLKPPPRSAQRSPPYRGGGGHQVTVSPPMGGRLQGFFKANCGTLH